MVVLPFVRKFKQIHPIQNIYGFDGELATFFACCIYQMEKTKYVKDSKRDGWFLNPFWEIFICNKEIMIAVKRDLSRSLIIFNCDDNVMRIQTNLSTIKKNDWDVTEDDIQKIRVHGDLFTLYSNIIDKYYYYIFKLKVILDAHITMSISIAGHGQGSVLANYFALEFYPRFTDRLLVYTFGSLKPGNNYFANYYNERLGNRTFNICEKHDILKYLPFNFLDDDTLNETFKKAKVALSFKINSLLVGTLVPVGVLFQIAAIIGPSFFYIFSLLEHQAFCHVGLKFFLNPYYDLYLLNINFCCDEKSLKLNHDILSGYYDNLMSTFFRNNCYNSISKFTIEEDSFLPDVVFDDSCVLEDDFEHNNKNILKNTII